MHMSARQEAGEMAAITEDGRSKSLTDEAYAAIREAIIRWDLAPGDHMTELHLSTTFGFGRAAVRAALTRLCHERLVQVMPRRGYMVAPITFKDVQDMFGVRLIVEPAAARQVALRADEALIAQLEHLNEACEYRSGPYDPGALRHANKRFHVAVAQATGNERLADIISASLDELQRILYLPQIAKATDTVESTFSEHRRVIEAFRRRDDEAAERAMYEHILHNKDAFIGALLSSSTIRSLNLVGL
jgi:DNA-binding GntR family transcriptional regulator